MIDAAPEVRTGTVVHRESHHDLVSLLAMSEPIHLAFEFVVKIVYIPEPGVHLVRWLESRDSEEVDMIASLTGLRPTCKVFEAGATELHTEDLLDGIEAVHTVGIGTILDGELELVRPLTSEGTFLGLVIPGEDTIIFTTLENRVHAVV